MTVPVADHSKRPRIGLVVPALELGGGVPSVADFAYKTVEQSGEFDVKLVSLASAARDDLGVALTKPRSWFRGIGTERGVWKGRQFTKVGAFLSEFEPRRHYPRGPLAELLADCDIIQVICGSAACAWSVCGLGKPVAVHCATRAFVERRRRDASAHYPSALWRREMTRLVDRLERKTLQTVDAVQVMNTWMLDYAAELNAGRDALIRFVPPGVDADRFQPSAYRDVQSNPYLLCVGRLDDPRKNLGLLLDSYALMPEKLKGLARVVLAGSAPPPPSFWTRVQDLSLGERVTFVSSPTAEELTRLYQGAAALVSTSDEEGFGMVLLEAMACGVPVVSTASGGPNGIIVDGQDGFLVDLGDAATLSARLTRLLCEAETNRRFGRAARQAIISKFASGVAGTALLDVYEHLLSVSPRSRALKVSRTGTLQCVE